MDAFDECFGISHGYIDRLGMTGRLLKGVFDPYERCSVSYVVIKPSDSISIRCNEEKEALSETKQQQLRDEMGELGMKMKMGTSTSSDDERYAEISRLLRGGKRKSKKRKSKKKRKSRKKSLVEKKKKSHKKKPRRKKKSKKIKK